MSVEAPVLLVIELEPAETSSFPVGASVRFHITAVDADTKQQVDLDTITFTVTAPFQTPTTPAVTRNSQGNYQVDVALNLAGKWRAQATGVLAAVSVTSNTTEIYAVGSAWW